MRVMRMIDVCKKMNEKRSFVATPRGGDHSGLAY